MAEPVGSVWIHRFDKENDINFFSVYLRIYLECTWDISRTFLKALKGHN